MFLINFFFKFKICKLDFKKLGRIQQILTQQNYKDTTVSGSASILDIIFVKNFLLIFCIFVLWIDLDVIKMLKFFCLNMVYCLHKSFYNCINTFFFSTETADSDL